MEKYILNSSFTSERIRATCGCMLRTARFIPCLAIALFIFWASSQPGSDFQLFLHADKIIHYTIYALLMLSCIYGAEFPGAKETRFWALLCVLYAVSDEWHQSFVPGREATLGDVLADVFGVVSVVMVSMFWVRRRQPQ
jgi:hypothetical protein